MSVRPGVEWGQVADLSCFVSPSSHSISHTFIIIINIVIIPAADWLLLVSLPSQICPGGGILLGASVCFWQGL